MGVHRVEASTSVGVPELDATVSAAASRGEEVLLKKELSKTNTSCKVYLPWAPGNGLDGGCVVFEGELRSNSAGGGFPDSKNVVVATRSKLKTIGGPFKSANFLSVVLEGCSVVLLEPHIVKEDGGIAGTRGKNVTIP